MNREALEHLIIDRRFGELPDDVATLLDAYLRTSPDDEALAGRIDSELALAQEALRPAASEDMPLPPFPMNRISDALATPRPVDRPSWQRPLALAAVLALGIFIGARLSTPQTQEQPSIGTFAFNDSAVEPGKEGDFWSLSAHRASRPSSKNATRPVEWSSPLRWPVKGESL